MSFLRGSLVQKYQTSWNSLTPGHSLSSFKQIKRTESNFLPNERKDNFLFPYCKMWTDLCKGKIPLSTGQKNAPFPVQQNSPNPPPLKSTGVLLLTSSVQPWKLPSVLHQAWKLSNWKKEKNKPQQSKTSASPTLPCLETSSHCCWELLILQ